MMKKTGEVISETRERADWEMREVYANFGLAVYFCQVLETGLVNYLALLRRSHDGFGLTDEEHDAVFEELFGRTFGRNLTEARRLLGPAAGLIEDLDEALAMRNDLVHHWLRERALVQQTSEQRNAIIEELIAAQGVMVSANQSVERHFRTLWEDFGLSWDLIEEEYRNLRSSPDGASGPLGYEVRSRN